MLSSLDMVLAARIHVVVTAHAKMRKFEQPDEMDAYDRWKMKLSKQVAPLPKEWCDILFFCNYQTFLVTSENNTQKAQDSKRVMYTSHHPAWDAKSRVALPEVLELDYKHIAHIFSMRQAAKSQAAPANQTVAQPTPTPQPPIEPEEESAADVLRGVLKEKGVTEEEIRQVIANRGKYSFERPIDDYPPELVFGYVIRYWDQIMDIIQVVIYRLIPPKLS